MAGPYQRLSNGQSADSGAQAITTVVNAVEAGLEDAEAAITSQAAAISGKASTSHTHTGTYDPAGSASTAQAAAVQRANHTGTQTASTISDFNTAVRTNRIDQLAAPTTAVGMGSQRITSLGTPSASTDAATKGYADSVAGLPEGTYNVKTYGATGNGSTDDTSAINSAIAALNATTRGGTLYFPPGTYKVTSGLTAITKPCRIQGGGGTSQRYLLGFWSTAIQQTSKTAHTFTISAGGVTVSDLLIWNTTYGDGATITGSWPHTVKTTAVPTAGSGILVDPGTSDGTTGVIIERCQFYGFYRNIDISSGLETTVRSCYLVAPAFQNIRTANPLWYDAGGTVVEDCRFIGVENYAIIDTHVKWESGGGFWFRNNMCGDAAHSSGLTGFCKYIIDVDCAVANAGYGQTAITRDISITGNHFEGHGRSGGAAVRITVANSADDSLDDVIIANNWFNTFQSTTESYDGVRLTGGTTNEINQVSITGNTFHGGAGTTGYAVKLTRVTNALIGNVIDTGTFTGSLSQTSCTAVTNYGM